MMNYDDKYRSLFEFAPIGISFVDRESNIIEANNALLKITGITFESLKTGRYKSRMYVHPDGCKFLPEEFPNCIAITENRSINNVEIGIITEEGRTVWTEVSASSLKNEDNRAIVITQDITERKILQKELIESEERMRLASIAAGFGTYSYEFGTGEAFYSEEFLNLYGHLPGETIELDDDLVAKAIHPEDKALFLSAMQNANDPQGSGILDIEFRIFLPGGELRWLRTQGLTVFSRSDGTFMPLRANGILQNITEQKNAENHIQKIDSRYRLIMENSGLGIGYYDIEGNILIFNEEALKNLGGNASDFIGKNLVEVFGTEAGNSFIERIKLVSKSETPVKYEEFLKLKGRPGWYLSTHTRILDHNGKVDGIQVISENITIRKLAEKKLLESQRKQLKLARHLQVVRENERLQISMNLHDDLGQKLTALKLDLAWIKSRMGVQSETVSQRMTDLNQNVNEAIESIKELAYSLRPSILFDLGLIPAIKWQLEKFTAQTGIKYQFNHEPAEVKIDDKIALILFRVIQESLTNIVRHSLASIVEVTVHLLKNRIEISVKDNGIGISYNKVRSMASMGIVGIQDRVSSVNGKVSIRGKKDFGTIIKISIPLNRKKNMIKVLITDDHPVVRRGIKHILEDAEKIVIIHEAGSGREMFDMLRIEKYDVILLDVSLPGGNGIDLIGQIKKIHKSAAILILSIHSEEMYAISALQSGASGYLSKMSAPEELITAIYKVAKGERYISATLAEKLADNLLSDLKEPIYRLLSAREMEVLHLFAAGKTVSQIADNLSLSPKTISTYRERLLEKLKLKTTADLIRYYILKGLNEQK